MRKFEAYRREHTIDCYSEITVIEKPEDSIYHKCIADVWTSEADAQLLAAAPELLEQLKQLVHLAERNEPGLFCIEAAKALISKLEERTK